MSKLLQALDQAIRTDFEGVKEAVMDKTYMGQLVAVQHQRGAQGGHIFAGLMMLDAQCRKFRIFLPLDLFRFNQRKGGRTRKIIKVQMFKDFIIVFT